MKKVHIAGVCLSAAIVAVLCCLVVQLRGRTTLMEMSQVTPSVGPQSTPRATTSPVDTKVFRDAERRFELRLPSTWLASEVPPPFIDFEGDAYVFEQWPATAASNQSMALYVVNNPRQAEGFLSKDEDGFCQVGVRSETVQIGRIRANLLTCPRTPVLSQTLEFVTGAQHYILLSNGLTPMEFRRIYETFRIMSI